MGCSSLLKDEAAQIGKSSTCSYAEDLDFSCGGKYEMYYAHLMNYLGASHQK